MLTVKSSISVSLWLLESAVATPLQFGAADVDVASCVEIGNYSNVSNRALLSVNYVRNSPHPCDLDLIQTPNARGSEGVFAMKLIYLYDTRINVFMDQSRTSVNDDLVVALIGLFGSAINDNGFFRDLSCTNLDTGVLEHIGLPASRIKGIICGSGPCVDSPLDNSTSFAYTSITSSTTAIAGSIPSGTVSASSLGTSSMSMPSSNSGCHRTASIFASRSSSITSAISMSISSSIASSSPGPVDSVTSLTGYES